MLLGKINGVNMEQFIVRRNVHTLKAKRIQWSLAKNSVSEIHCVISVLQHDKNNWMDYRW